MANQGVRDLFEQMGGKENTGVIRDDWMCAVEAIVADVTDQENQHRIRVVIPSIDENEIHDVWVKRLMWWTGPQGYGDYHLPDLGSEVVLFGRMEEKFTLYYAPVYNEDYQVPVEFQGRTDVRGFKTDQSYEEYIGLNHLTNVTGNEAIQVEGAMEITVVGALTITAALITMTSASKIMLNAPAGVFVNGVQLVVP